MLLENYILGTPGISPNVDFQELENMLAFFNAFFDDELVNEIAVQTNTYAEQVRSNQWRYVTSDEIRIFLALNILQSVVKKPCLQDYWTKNHILATPFFRQAMSYKRFIAIKQYLHFSNNADYDAENHPNPKLNKIWPVYSKLSQKFSSLYTPERDVTIDESLLLYKGRLGWVQYIPLKRARFGIKSYMLCESKSGYVWGFIIYTGKGTNFDADYQNLPMGSQVVLSLMKPLLCKGYCLTTDNFYTSPELADILISNKTDTYGTMKTNRKEIPPAFRSKKLKAGEIVAFQRGKVLIMRWRDKKDVTLLSTIHNIETKTYEKRGKDRTKPILVIDYNYTMGGVDKVDQHLSDYPVTRKRGKKYYKKIFFHLLELALWNSYILYKKCGGVKSPLQYRLCLIKEMFEKYHPNLLPSTSGRPSKSPNPLRMSKGHYPDYVPATEKKQCPTRRCVMCSRKRDNCGKPIRRESRYCCSVCDVGLCVVPCFKDYHTA